MHVLRLVLTDEEVKALHNALAFSLLCATGVSGVLYEKFMEATRDPIVGES